MNLVNKVKKHAGMYDDVGKVVLAFSGGLDTSVMLKVFSQILKKEVIAVNVLLGGSSRSDVEEKAKELGATKCYILDCEGEFYEDYITKAIKANSLYQGCYPNSTALGRPLIAKKLVDVAKTEGADAIVHGCTGKGNDQVRLEVCISTLDPEMKIIAPIRDWNLKRTEELSYAKSHGIYIKEGEYSVDENIWGRSIEGGTLEDPSSPPPSDIFKWVDDLGGEKEVKVYFEKGVPVRMESGEKILGDGLAIIKALNRTAGECGFGIVDHMEDRVVGMKSREVYECPAALSIISAHKDLEKYVLTKEENRFKRYVDERWTDMVYGGLWYHPLMSELNAFINETQKKVEGWVLMKFGGGSMRILGRYSPYGLYDSGFVGYDGEGLDQKMAEGFVKIYGMSSVLSRRVGP